MPNSITLPLIYIKLNGANVASDWIADLEEVVVDRVLGAPDMVTLRFADPRLARLESSIFTIGAALEISINAGNGAVVVANVEVASVEPEVLAGGESTLQVRAYNKMARLHFKRNTRSFLRQKDSDIVSQIAGQVGLQASVTATTTQYEYLVQWNQTDMEFLMERANRIGHQLFVDNTTLYFQPAGTTRGTAVVLDYAVSLLSFQPRMTAVRQATQVTVRGWDPATKQAVVGVASTPAAANQGGVGSTGGDKLQSAYGGAAPIFIVDEHVISQSDAQKVAQGALDQLNREWVEIEGVAMLSPTIKPAGMVTVQHVPGGFNGTYFVSGVRHVWTAQGGSTSFTVSGRLAQRHARLLDGSGSGQKVYGVWPAVVTNNNDPDNKGRVKVKFAFMPQNNGADLESAWARLCTPMAGPSRGLMILPEVNDEVLVAFGGGNPADPYIVGSLWNGRDAPPLTSANAVASGAVKQRLFQTRAGHKVLFDDSTDAAKIRIDDHTGQFIEIISKPDGSRKITISGEKDMDILCKGNLKIDSKGKIDITSTGNMTLKSSAQATIESTGNMTVKSSAQAAIESSAPMTIKSNATLSISAAATAELKANATLSLSGTAMAELKGALVKIN